MDGWGQPQAAHGCCDPYAFCDPCYAYPTDVPIDQHQPYVSAHPLQVNNSIHTDPYYLRRPSRLYSYDYDWNYPGLPDPENLYHPAPRRLTAVVLPTRRFHVSHTLLTHLLPRAAMAPLTGPFSPLAFLGPAIATRFPPALFPDPGPSVLAALTLLFEGLERISRDDGTQNLFSGLELGPQNARDQVRVAADTFRLAFALCVVLDMSAGFGCADELAEHVGWFLLDLMPRLYVLEVEGRNRAVCAVVLGFAKVFRGTAECVEVLAGLWGGLGGGEREFVVGTLREGLVAGGVDSNAHRMWRALGEMGIVGRPAM